MPIYDFECVHQHRFEHFCKMADRGEPVPCEGFLDSIIMDDTELALYTCDDPAPLPEGYRWKDKTSNGKQDMQKDILAKLTDDCVLVKKVKCSFKANLLVGTHNNPAGFLDHGSASNRDAAREGRYDPLNPSRRFMSKGRKWRA